MVILIIYFLKLQGWDWNTTFRTSHSAYTDVCKQLFQLKYHNTHASLPFQYVSHTLYLNSLTGENQTHLLLITVTANRSNAPAY